MARRSKDDGTGAAGLLLIAAAVVFAIITALLTLIAYFGYYIAGFGLLLCQLMSRKKPNVSQAAELYSPEEYSSLLALQNECERLTDVIDQTNREADQQALSRRTHDPSRFDERKPQAKRINARLDKMDVELAQVGAQVLALSSDVTGRYNEWLKRAHRWRFWKSGTAACGASLCVYAVTLGILFLLHPSWVENTSAFVFKYSWLSWPNNAHAKYGANLVAFIIAAPVALLVWMIRLNQIEISLPDEAAFRSLWYMDDEDEGVDEPHSDDEPSMLDGEKIEADEQTETPTVEDQAEEAPAWYSVLGVSANSSVDEINSAYRAQIKQYHPDKVAGMGPKIREVAEEQTRLLNAAREEGLSRVNAGS